MYFRTAHDMQPVRQGKTMVELDNLKIEIKQYEGPLQELKDSLSGVTELTIDLGKLDYISSAGLRVLLATFKQMKAVKGSMNLTNVGQSFKNVLQNTGLDAVFDMQ